MKIVNECRVDFQYEFGYHKITKTIYSNKVSTDIVYNMLEVNKSVDKIKANIFELLSYTINISNISGATVNNIFFKDNLIKGVKFICNSVYINGVQHMYINPKEGFDVGAIESKKNLIISFKVVITPDNEGMAIANNANVIYDYIYNLDMLPLRMSISSNMIYTEINNNLFKQLHVDYTFIIDCDNYHIKQIEDVGIKINIIENKIVGTPIKSTKDYICNTLYNLIILGNIEYTITYSYFTENNEINIRSGKIIETEGFSSFLLVPHGAIYYNFEKINSTVENIYYDLVNDKTIFIDVTLLLNL